MFRLHNDQLCLDRYAPDTPANARLIALGDINARRFETLANAKQLIRHLVNTPTSDLGSEQLQIATETLSEECSARCSDITGSTLLDQDFPMIHAVEPATIQAPRLTEKNEGENGPKLTLVGKGECFYAGKLNLKPDASMRLMKKDMGGADNFLKLAQMIMKPGFNVRLRILIPAVENAVANNAFRRGNILTARNRQTVEINNTDAEDRLVQADTLALAHKRQRDRTISVATLTGSARAAVEADVAQPYTEVGCAAEASTHAGCSSADPVKRIPIHEPYEAMIEPSGADPNIAHSGGLAISLTVVAFLHRFVGDILYIHSDIYSWKCKKPGRTKGGLGREPHALQAALPEAFCL